MEMTAPPSLRVLLVEGDAEALRVARSALERHGHDVRAVSTSADATAGLVWQPDVVILGCSLPDGEGVDLIPAIRAARPRAHVVCVRSSASESDWVAGLAAGADDCLVAPVSARELLARVTVYAHRLAREQQSVLQLGPLVIDAQRRLVHLHDQPLQLTRREFELLRHLATNRGRAVSRAELLAVAWSSSAEWQSPATVTEHVRRVRGKLETDPAAPRWITSIRGVGYRFDVPTDVEDEADAPAFVIVRGATIVHATPPVADLVGVAGVQAVVGRDVCDFLAPGSVAAFDRRTADGEVGAWPRPEIVTLRRADGSEVHAEVASVPVTWDGQPCSQITLWPLDGRTQPLRTLVTGIAIDVAEAVILSSADFRIESFNAAAEALYGWQEAEVLGKHVAEVLPWVGTEEDLAAAAATLTDTGHWHGRAVQRRRDGAPVAVMANTTLLRDVAGRPVGVISVNRPTSDPPLVDPPVDACLADEIQRGLAADEFFVEYQPIVRLIDRTVIGYEALVRWQHPDRGRVPPLEFIEAAERIGAINDIGSRVLELACAQLARWHRDGPEVHLAVNVSARQLDHHLVDHLVALIARHDLRADALWLEVTETALVDDLDRAVATLRQIVDLGVRIAIDDFGTGWATLTYLRQFPVSALKVDSVFVDQICTRPCDAAIVRSVLSLGNELDLAVIAEGIECEEQVDALLQMGCTLGQGFLFGRPRPAS
jgi:PAS domain S-box-containing protein